MQQFTKIVFLISDAWVSIYLIPIQIAIVILNRIEFMSEVENESEWQTLELGIFRVSFCFYQVK